MSYRRAAVSLFDWLKAKVTYRSAENTKWPTDADRPQQTTDERQDRCSPVRHMKGV